MRLLLTGCNGQVGSELASRAESGGHEFIATTRETLDITQRAATDSFISEYTPDIVINAAAYTAVDRAEQDADSAFAVNRDGAANLAQACANANTPLLHISTDYVFDGEKHGAYLESDSTNPQGVYGLSKLEGELQIVKALQQHIIMRVSWVFGANGHNFVRTMLRLGQERNELHVVGDQCGGPTWAGDIANTLLTIANAVQDKRFAAWGIYHYSGAPATSWHGFAEAIFDNAERLGMLDNKPRVHNIATAEYPTPAKRPKNSVFDCSLIHKNFAIRQPAWHEGLSQVLNTWKTA
ncbi:MAG: dTDP-4-dehydrorhamnose reductase [Gammaproteobacteria bacterium]